jgi:hypothetical protein
MPRGIAAFESAAGPVGHEIVVAFVQVHRINGFERVQSVVRRRPNEAGVAAIGNNKTNSVVLRHGAVSS